MEEDPENPQNPKIDIVSTFYTIPEYNAIKFKIKENETLRTKIKQLKTKCDKISKSKQRNIKHKRERKYNRKTNSKYQKPDLDEISKRKLHILIKLPNGKSIPLKVDSYERISNVKLRIAEEEGIEMDSQKLYYFFKELRDDKLLVDYKIQNNSIIKLSVKAS